MATKPKTAAPKVTAATPAVTSQITCRMPAGVIARAHDYLETLPVRASMTALVETAIVEFLDRQAKKAA